MLVEAWRACSGSFFGEKRAIRRSRNLPCGHAPMRGVYGRFPCQTRRCVGFHGCVKVLDTRAKRAYSQRTHNTYEKDALTVETHEEVIRAVFDLAEKRGTGGPDRREERGGCGSDGAPRVPGRPGTGAKPLDLGQNDCEKGITRQVSGRCGHPLRLVRYRERQESPRMGSLTIRQASSYGRRPGHAASSESRRPSCS